MALTLARLRRAIASGRMAPVLGGRALEIVDAPGKIRASIDIYPAITRKTGVNYPEAVVAQTDHRAPASPVTLRASEDLAGRALMGASGTIRRYVQLGAAGAASSMNPPSARCSPGRQLLQVV